MRRGALAAFALLAIALLAGSLRSGRLASGDAFTYVDVARHLARGDGLRTSVLNLHAARFDPAATWPAPFVSQPPLYPLLAAATIRAGIEPARAALLVSMLALFATGVFAARVAGRLHGEAAGWLALALLALVAAVPELVRRAWSEPLGIALALASLDVQLGVLARSPAAPRAWRAMFAGVLAGLALATRTSLVIAFPVGLLFWRDARRPRAGAGDALAFAAGWAALAVPLAWWNLHAAGSLLGVSRRASESNASGVLASLARALAHGDGWRWLVAFAVLPVAIVLVAAGRSGTLRARLRLAFSGPALAPAAWCAAYLLVLVGVRSSFAFDTLGVRLLAPAAVLGVVFAAGVLARATAWGARPAAALALVVALALAVPVAVRAAHDPPVPPARHIAWSPRLSWIRDHVAADDLLVGDDPVDLPYFFAGADGGPRPVAALSPAPYMAPLDAATLRDFVRRHRPSGAHAWLVLRRPPGDDAATWSARFGPFIADVVSGRDGSSPGILLVATLADAFVFEFLP